ncbi:MAG TPA: S8 family peptidase [Clostridia bacterium]|jgi:serine protease AprX|nr:S8 family peptidase [Clostridia bacterium]
MDYSREILLLLLLKNLMTNPYRRASIDPRLVPRIKRSGNERIPIILYHKGHSLSHMEKCLCRHPDVKLKHHLPIIKAVALEVPARMVHELAVLDEVEYVTSDTKVFIHMDVARETIREDRVDPIKYTGKGVGVAVIDTGAAPHPDLVEPDNRIIAFKDYVNQKKEPYDDNGHGTHVAGCIAGNGSGSDGKYSGIAPKANIIAIKTLNSEGSGDSSDVIAAIQWALDNRARYNIKVLNLSLGSKPQSLSYSPIDKAVSAAWEKGMTVICAAGNEGPGRQTISSPGICPEVITVGALDDRDTAHTKDDIIASFSSRGPTKRMVAKPDIVAPGVNIISLAVPSRDNVLYKSLSGTSMATPIVSGCAALIHEMFPDYTNQQVKELMMSTAKDLNYPSYAQGKGLIDLAAIVKAREGGVTY